MQLDLIAGLQERFSVSAEQLENLKNTVISERSFQKTPSENPTLIIVGGQEGSYKPILRAWAEKELSNNAIVLSTNELREYHPLIAQIRVEYPDMLQLLTADLARTLLLSLENYAIQKKLHVIFDATLGNPIPVIQKINKYKTHGYQIDLKIVSIHKMFSYLNTEESYEQMLLIENNGRTISKQQHDKDFDNISLTLQKLYEKDLLDKIMVYQCEITQNDGVIDANIDVLSDNKNTYYNAYIQERNRDFTDIEFFYLKEKAQNVKAMKISREANFLEKVRFEFNFKFILDGKGSKGKKKKIELE